MGKRTTIGLIYSRNENWIAGTYYIENLISALKSLPDGHQPFLKIYCYQAEEYDELLKKTNYQHSRPIFIKDVKSLVGRLINRLSFSLFKKHWMTGKTDRDVDVIFPNPWSYHFDKFNRKLFWIPDFQEKHYSGFFTKEQLELRANSHEELVRKQFPVVFSSEHAKSDFLNLYPRAKNRLFVMPFAVTLPDDEGIHLTELIKRYAIPMTYFICSNQFWAHKNHQVVLRAAKFLKDRGREITIVFTGKPYDNRNPKYYGSLMAQVEKDNLNENVIFLGFIPRSEQVVLMKNARAIIQPSLFEGWSTVVEDAKALSQTIIISDIPVHREQLPGYEFFFSPEDHESLGRHMEFILQHERKGFSMDYQENVRAFGRTFMRIVDSFLE